MNADGRAGRLSLPRLGVFLLLSICAHIALLAGLNTSPAVPRRAELPLSVSLNFAAAKSPATKNNKSRRVIATARAATPNKAAMPESTIDMASMPRTDAVEDGGVDARATADPALSDERVREQVQAFVLADLQGYFANSYPPIARRRGWEGTVSLTITIQPDGRLAGVRITRGSGYDMLDQAAVATLRRIERVAKTHLFLLNDRPLEVPLPIVYRLTN